MMDRSAHGVQSSNRIQYETGTGGKRVLQEYWIHEWNNKGYDMHEHIKDLVQAISRAKELGYNDEAKKLEQFKNSGD